jgi:hypothetical protein
MARRRKKSSLGICVYCGSEVLLTEDHIPPKGLYPESVWSSLLKIPSCVKCNGGASKDDEYLRTVIGLSAKGERDEILKPVSDATVRALARPEAAGFRRSIVKGIRETFISSPAGILVPALVGNVDLSRLDRVAARIIKGLFFTERGMRLPSDYSVVNYSSEGLRQVPMAVGRQLQTLIEALLAREPKHIGGPQFLYWSDYNPDDPNQSTWLLVIHRHHFFIGWTVKKGGAI